MSGTRAGTQTIGCRVTSCRYNHEGSGCSLSKIEVEPSPNCNTGEPCDESLCGSYVSRS
jgi:hypothetical protein